MTSKVLTLTIYLTETSKVLTLTIYLTEMKCHGCITYTSTFRGNYMLRLYKCAKEWMTLKSLSPSYFMKIFFVYFS